MCRYNHWVYTEGSSSFGVFQVIGLEEAYKNNDETEDGVEIEWNFADFKKGPASTAVSILNMAGEHIRTIDMKTEIGRVMWDLRNTAGDICSAGVYIAVIEAGLTGGRLPKTRLKLALANYSN